MKKLYIIKSGNRFNQIMVFTNYNKAFQWCLKATNWRESLIEERIQVLERNWLGAFDIFPNN